MSIPVYQSEYPCSYIEDGRKTTIEFFYPDDEMQNHYSVFLSNGYRRYKDIFYHNVCKDCSECQALRLPVKGFRLSKSQRRTLKMNKDIKTKILVATAPDLERVELFSKYKQTKHPDGESHDYFTEVYNIHAYYNHTLEVDYYLGEKLVGVSILDEAADALSANYFYYDTDYLDRRLGVFSALIEIYYAKLFRKPYYYLGFYIESVEKMRYKKFFRPNEVLVAENWEPLLGNDAGGE